jgi:hypothetical protein
VLGEVQQGVLAYCDSLIRTSRRWSLSLEPFRACAVTRLAELLCGRFPEELAALEGVELGLGWSSGNRLRIDELVGFSRASNPGLPPPTTTTKHAIGSPLRHAEESTDAQRILEKVVALLELLEQEHKLVFYGVGTVARLLAPHVLERVSFFVDRNSELHGRTFLGRPICSPEALREAGDHAVFVTPLHRKRVIEPALADFGLRLIFVDDHL